MVVLVVVRDAIFTMIRTNFVFVFELKTINSSFIVINRLNVRGGAYREGRLKERGGYIIIFGKPLNVLKIVKITI